MVIDTCWWSLMVVDDIVVSRCRLLMVVSSRISHDLRSKGFISHHYSHHQWLQDLLVLVIDLWPWGVPHHQKQMALSNVNGIDLRKSRHIVVGIHMSVIVGHKIFRVIYHDKPCMNSVYPKIARINIRTLMNHHEPLANISHSGHFFAYHFWTIGEAKHNSDVVAGDQCPHHAGEGKEWSGLRFRGVRPPAAAHSLHWKLPTPAAKMIHQQITAGWWIFTFEHPLTWRSTTCDTFSTLFHLLWYSMLNYRPRVVRSTSNWSTSRGTRAPVKQKPRSGPRRYFEEHPLGGWWF